MRVSNNARAHVYLSSSVDFKHKGLESLFLHILVENLWTILFITFLGDNPVTNGDGMRLKS